MGKTLQKSLCNTHQSTQAAAVQATHAHAFVLAVASASVVAAGLSDFPRVLARQEVGQSDAELPSKRGESTARDQGHDDEEEHLGGIAAHVVPELAQKVLQLVDQAFDVAIARATFVVGRRARPGGSRVRRGAMMAR